MMNIVGTDISMVRGDSETMTISCTNSQTNLPVPFVTGDTVYFTVKEDAKFTQKKLQKIVTAFVDGKAIINITPQDTKNLEFKNYVYDIQLTAYDTTVKTIIPISVFAVEKEVTYE
ncbi:MAG: hypothetical protein WCO84_01365 [bacterium]